MAQNLEFQKVGGGVGTISLDQIQRMSIPEFVMLEGRLMKVRRKKRRDLAIWQAGTMVTTDSKKTIFRLGLNQQDKFANVDVAFVKTRAHTNMHRNGEFEQGSVTIISKIEAFVYQTGLEGTTEVAGMVTNPKGLAVAGLDPYLLVQSWLNQTYLSYYEGEELISDGLLEEYPQGSGISGVMGNTVGGIAQNALIDNNALDNVRVLIGGADFEVRLEPLCPFDLTVATGVPVDIVTEIKLRTIEFRTSNP